MSHPKEIGGPAPLVTQSSIVAALRQAGIAPGDALLVHSSLKSFGQVDGGADAVVDALLEAVGPVGLVAVPTMSHCSLRPPSPDPDYLPLVYHPAKTPSRVGLITETLRRRSGAVRSLHPTHSVAALGPEAHDMARFHGPDSHFGRHTPYGWLVRRGAKIVLMGVKMNANTLLHAIEELADMPSLLDNVALVEGPDGSVQQVLLRGAPLGHRDFYSSKRISKAEVALRDRHLVLDFTIGAAQCMLVNAQEQELVLMREVFGKQPDILFCDAPACQFCQAARAQMLCRYRPTSPPSVQAPRPAAPTAVPGGCQPSK